VLTIDDMSACLIAWCVVVGSYVVCRYLIGPAYATAEGVYPADAISLGGSVTRAGCSLPLASAFWIGNNPRMVFSLVRLITLNLWRISTLLVHEILRAFFLLASGWKSIEACVILNCRPPGSYLAIEPFRSEYLSYFCPVCFFALGALPRLCISGASISGMMRFRPG
jgi:hypothetical protein